MQKLDEQTIAGLSRLHEDYAPPSVRGDEADAAVVDAMFLMAAADGKISPEETGELARAVKSIFGHAHEGDLAGWMSELSAALDEDGWDRRLRAVAKKLGAGASAERAFVLAAGIAFIDDHLAHQESGALDAMATAFGLTSDRAHELMAKVHDRLFGNRT